MNEVIVVSGSRVRREEFDLERPAIGLRRPADFAIMSVAIAGDTRDMERRREEIFTMVRSAVEQAQRSGVGSPAAT